MCTKASEDMKLIWRRGRLPLQLCFFKSLHSAWLGSYTTLFTREARGAASYRINNAPLASLGTTARGSVAAFSHLRFSSMFDEENTTVSSYLRCVGAEPYGWTALSGMIELPDFGRISAFTVIEESFPKFLKSNLEISCVCRQIYIYIYTCTDASVCAYIYIFCTYTYRCICMCVYLYSYRSTHTHTPRPPIAIYVKCILLPLTPVKATFHFFIKKNGTLFNGNMVWEKPHTFLT